MLVKYRGFGKNWLPWGPQAYRDCKRIIVRSSRMRLCGEGALENYLSDRDAM